MTLQIKSLKMELDKQKVDSEKQRRELKANADFEKQNMHQDTLTLKRQVESHQQRAVELELQVKEAQLSVQELTRRNRQLTEDAAEKEAAVVGGRVATLEQERVGKKLQVQIRDLELQLDSKGRECLGLERQCEDRRQAQMVGIE